MLHFVATVALATISLEPQKNTSSLIGRSRLNDVHLWLGFALVCVVLRAEVHSRQPLDWEGWYNVASKCESGSQGLSAPLTK